ncbi:hypothetical protein DFH08DRAFT_935051 [Mycena albidolilacea]|uniref:Uncharacterized protein n=1 Tax=Mycena albidolilacea TaxID=1033008 RepID=A0AAD7EVD5_9AGAR|nr:hypothetical protein DFH08DRAFT_935051 [Mycena albidolilacea]
MDNEFRWEDQRGRFSREGEVKEDSQVNPCADAAECMRSALQVRTVSAGKAGRHGEAAGQPLNYVVQLLDVCQTCVASDFGCVKFKRQFGGPERDRVGDVRTVEASGDQNFPTFFSLYFFVQVAVVGEFVNVYNTIEVAFSDIPWQARCIPLHAPPVTRAKTRMSARSPQIPAVHDKEAEDEGEEDDARILTANGKRKVTK